MRTSKYYQKTKVLKSEIEECEQKGVNSMDMAEVSFNEEEEIGEEEYENIKRQLKLDTAWATANRKSSKTLLRETYTRR